MTAPNHSIQELLQLAIKTAVNAHAPYSKFPVGCVIVDARRQVHIGCNVENASLGLTMCAERVATGNAIAAGATAFETVIIASQGAVSPCGACRQVLAEFCSRETKIICVDLDNANQQEHTLANLLPQQFEFPTTDQ